MQALTATQVILWEDGSYSAITLAVNTKNVPISMSGDSRRMTLNELLSHLARVRDLCAGQTGAEHDTSSIDGLSSGNRVPGAALERGRPC
jgi:hypothetical protein